MQSWFQNKFSRAASVLALAAAPLLSGCLATVERAARGDIAGAAAEAARSTIPGANQVPPSVVRQGTDAVTGTVGRFLPVTDAQVRGIKNMHGAIPEKGPVRFGAGQNEQREVTDTQRAQLVQLVGAKVVPSRSDAGFTIEYVGQNAPGNGFDLSGTTLAFNPKAKPLGLNDEAGRSLPRLANGRAPSISPQTLAQLVAKGTISGIVVERVINETGLKNNVQDALVRLVPYSQQGGQYSFGEGRVVNASEFSEALTGTSPTHRAFASWLAATSQYPTAATTPTAPARPRLPVAP